MDRMNRRARRQGRARPGRALLLALALPAGTLAAGTAQAQAPVQTPAPSSAPAPAPAGGAIALPEIDVNAAPAAATGYAAQRSTTATKTDTPLRDVPQSVTVITQEAIRDLSAQNLGDILRYVPGAGYAQGEGNRDTPVLRGQSTTSDLFVDGLRDDVQYYRDLYNIDRVEVLLGPNAMIFGRGGTGGVINRVTKQADWEQRREVRLQAGSYGLWRGSLDVGQAINENAAFRLLGMYEESDSYRDGVNIKRYGINPTFAFRIGNNTTIRASYEYFRDERTADRGIPSFGGRPLVTGRGTFFGDPGRSPVQAQVNALNLGVEHRFDNGVLLRNNFRFADYDKFYQNVFSGAVAANGRTVGISAYNNATHRTNLINQTDLVFDLTTGPFTHKVLAGMELGRQETDNFRNTGYFPTVGANATSFTTSLGATRINVPIAFRQSATDANNSGVSTTAAFYLQDQMQLLPGLQLIAGLRFDHFNTDFTNNRNGQRFDVTDNTVSPRVGLVWSPVAPLSLYASFSNTFLPRAGEQLASLTLANQALKPERFTNYEVGAKWDIRPEFALTAALYELDRTNVAVTDPNDITRLVLVDGTRTRGFELGARGRVTDKWSLLGGWAVQNSEITSNQSATIRKGNNVPFVPGTTLSLWNRYNFTEQYGAALGVIHQSGYYAATDNAVRIPAFTRFDAALFWNLSERVALQANFENLFGVKYYPVANSNNNITPGAPFLARVALTTRF
ncbi:TonB-dependent receptor [Paracraurococcus ruber]|uniref:TonB-dependent siderophore receptor n=1 Tax=Paracraurococcus ruber TaxID=77675 RepID=A0ABS1D2J7_9PROT|nr:TonB-dependent siderophore receptor [Paracraurococcus ruber]MBK1661058.1 TonB-dependent siderophore receptor [Paracraurococcus ruber]TDG27552.1 TonB-dependent siderophore receptor [Paracraurococcus ruber]